MDIKKGPFSYFKNPLFYAFCLPILYWIFLFFSTKMVLECDSLNYQYIGSLLYNQGWTEYFKTGPNREPFYPLLVSLSMLVSDVLPISFSAAQKLLQINFLFLTQLLSFIVLKKLHIRSTYTAATIFYIGISPALVNSAFSLYSEIATYPFVLVAVLLSARSWLNLHAKVQKNTILLGLLLGLSSLMITFIKGIFELVILLYLFPFVFLALKSCVKKNRVRFARSMIFLLAFAIAYYLPLNSYKFANKQYNGSFTLTNRGPWALHGNIARRSGTEALKRIPAAFAYLPGEGFCNAIFSRDSCEFWSASQSDRLGKEKFLKLRENGLSRKETEQALLRLSVQNLFQNPFQQTLFMILESFKMFFWETTKLGFVSYPRWMIKLFYFTPFKNSLRLFVFILTFFAFFLSWKFTWRKKDVLFSHTDKAREQDILLFFMLWFVSSYVIFHSLFFVLTRYALPVAPLYLILIAFSLQSTFKKLLKF